MANVIEAESERANPAREQEARPYELHRIRFPDGEIDPLQVVLSYDRPSDTVLLLLYGWNRRSLAVGYTDYVFLLVDPGSNEFVGLQIEDFLIRAVKDDPRLALLLEYAELRGTNLAEVRQECRLALQQDHGMDQQRNGGRARSHQPGAPSGKNKIIQDVLNDARLGLPMHVSLGRNQS